MLLFARHAVPPRLRRGLIFCPAQQQFRTLPHIARREKKRLGRKRAKALFF
jgi:hypothetical protein